MSSKTIRWLAVISAAGILGLMSATAALAHPHVFVKVKSKLLAKDGALVGLQHTWILDEQWLQSQLEEYDKDRDGRLTREELAPLEAESKATLEMFRSFTMVRSGGTPIRAVDPRDVVVDYQGDVLGLSFTVTLAKPVPLVGRETLLEVYDATFFSGFTFASPDAVTFAGEAPQGCSVTVGVAPSKQQLSAYRMVKQQIGPEFVDPGPPKSAAINCSGGA